MNSFLRTYILPFFKNSNLHPYTFPLFLAAAAAADQWTDVKNHWQELVSCRCVREQDKNTTGGHLIKLFFIARLLESKPPRGNFDVRMPSFYPRDWIPETHVVSLVQHFGGSKVKGGRYVIVKSLLRP